MASAEDADALETRRLTLHLTRSCQAADAAYAWHASAGMQGTQGTASAHKNRSKETDRRNALLAA